MRKNRSMGEMISTLSFFGLAVYLLILGLELLAVDQTLRGFGGLLAAVCCGLGGLRFFIADFVGKWRGE